MKKFLIKAGVIGILIAIVVSINALVDPYNVFHYKQARKNGVDPNKNYIKTKYVLDNKDKFDSFVIGASRCGYMNIDRLNDGTYYNLTYGGGNMYEFLMSLKVLVDSEVKIKNILLGLDEQAYTERHMHDNSLGALPYPKNNIKDKTGFYGKYLLDTFTTIMSVPLNFNTPEDVKDEYIYNLYTDGTWKAKDTVLSKETDVFENIKYDINTSEYEKELIEDSFRDLNEFVKICKDNNINLRVYTHPLHIKNYGDVIGNGYYDYLISLSEHVEFYNFSGMNDVTADYSNYYEWSHYNYDTTDKLIDVMYYNKTDEKLLDEGFGMYVTKDNNEEFKKILDGQLKDKTYEEEQ